MKRNAFRTILAVIALSLFGVVDAVAQIARTEGAPIWRFTEGRLPPGWSATGQAFVNQPVCTAAKTDRLRLPNGQKLARLGGDYWITPVDIGFSGCRIDSGVRTANGGTLTSPPFTITSRFLELLVGAGGGPATSVALILQPPPRSRLAPRVIFSYNGPGDLRMHKVRWDLTAQRGKTTRLVITDNSNDPDIVTRDKRATLLQQFRNCVTGANFADTNAVNLAGDLKQCQAAFDAGVKALDTVPAGPGIPAIMVADIRLTGAPQTLQPPAPPATVWGFADLHAHLFNHLGFGGQLFYGDNSGPIDKALAPCGQHSTCTTPDMGHGPNGWPTFEDWPKPGILAHQLAYEDWLKRAWEGGLRLVEVDVGNSEFLASSLAKVNSILADSVGKIDPKACHGLKATKPTNDRSVIEAQLTAAETFAKARSDWIEIAKSPADARRIVSEGKLAFVMGMEVEALGDFTSANCAQVNHVNPPPSCTKLGDVPTTVRDTLTAYLAELKSKHSVTHIIPIHLTENAFGAPALYNKVFEVSSWWYTGRMPRLRNGFKDSGMRYRLDIDAMDLTNTPSLATQIFAALDGFNTLPNDPGRYLTGEAVVGLGHMSADGLTIQGKILIEEMMKLGMVIDIDHMSDRSTEDTIEIAHRVGYPIFMSHTGFREQAFGTGVSKSFSPDRDTQASYGTSKVEQVASERLKTLDDLVEVRNLGGVVGIGIGPGATWKDFIGSNPEVKQDCDGTAKSFAQTYLFVLEHLGTRGVALGSDINGLNGMARARFGTEACGVSANRGSKDRPIDLWPLARAQQNGVSYATPLVDPHAYRFPATDTYPAANTLAALEREAWEAVAIFKAGVNIDTWDPRAPGRTDAERARIRNIVRGLQHARDGLAKDNHDPGEPGEYQTAAWLAFTLKGKDDFSQYVDQPGFKLKDKMYIKTIWDLWAKMEVKDQQSGEPNNPPLLRSIAGSRDFDINLDGIAHYGLVPDFLQDFKNILRDPKNVGPSEAEMAPLFRGAEDYIQMWQKAVDRSAEARKVFKP